MAKRTRPTHPARSTEVATTARPELDTEFANRLSDPFETAYMGVLRTNDPLLMERGNGGVQIYWDLRRDGKVFDGLQKRQLALIGKAWQVEPVKADSAKGTADAETLTGILKACNFDKLCSELLEALLAGYAVSEIVWTTRDGMWVPARVVQRAQRRFVYVQQDENSAPWLHLLTRENMLTGTPVPPRKFIVHRVNPQDDNPYGMGLGLQLCWPVFFKRKGIVAWNKLCDRFGSPTPHGKYPRNAGPKEKGTLADALRAFSNDGYVMTPEGMDIALLESKISGNVTTQEALCEYMDDWIGAVLTGQESRSSGGGALAAASKERQDVRQDLTQADSDLLSETLNQTLLAWICDYNGLEPCHVYRQIKEEDDIKAMAEADKIVSEMGFEMDLDTVRARYGAGWSKKAAAPPAAPLPPAPLVPEKPANFAEAGLNAAHPDQAALDAALAGLSPEQLQEQMQLLLQPVFDRLKSEQDPQAMLGWLAEQFPGLDESALQERLTRLMFAAAVWGRLHGDD